MLVFGVIRRLVFGVWCLVFGVWCLVFGVWCCLVFGVFCIQCALVLVAKAVRAKMALSNRVRVRMQQPSGDAV